MKLIGLVFSFFILLMLAACNQQIVDNEVVFEPNSEVLTDAEKSQFAEERLVKRLQEIIETTESVDQAVINIDTLSEAEKIVNILITTESNIQLTDEQKTGIINLIEGSMSNEITVTVNLEEEQQAD